MADNAQAKPIDVPGLLAVNKYEEPLQDYLHLQPPSELDKAVPVLSFERLREVDIPWARVLEGAVTGSQRGSLTPLKHYFEESWKLTGGRPAAPDNRVVEIAEDNRFFTVEFKPPPQPANARPVPTAVPVKKGSIALLDGYGRYHLCKLLPGKEIKKSDLLDPDRYDTFWKEGLQGVELCFQGAERALKGHTRVEYVDLAEKFILDAYDQLTAHQDFDKDLQEELKSSTKDLIKGAVHPAIDLDQLNRIQQTVLSLRLRKVGIQRRLERLVQKAAELGYVLALEDKKGFVEFPDKQGRDVTAGQLYRQFKREYQWTTTVERVECKARSGVRAVTSFFGIESPEPRRWQENKTHSQVVVDVELVKVKDDALIKKIDRLTNEDHREVFVFDRTPRGYVTEDGTSLREVMFRCERDEEFRCRCAVLLPVVEKALSGSQAITGYNVFIAPFPGIVPVAMPKLSILESLSYRLAWQEVQLGEVVNAINLAPGESRTITVRRSYEQETSFSQKRTTVFDLQESDTSDFSSEMERELTSERQSNVNVALSSSGKASAPIKGVNVEGSSSRSFGYNKSVKSISRTLSKVAKKASHKVNRNYRDEVSTDTRQTTKISNYDEYTSTLTNINEGRTLNLLFYRLYNLYRSGLYVDDLHFLVTPSVEIIAGSGIHDSVSFDATELEGLLREFGAARLPFDMDDIDEKRYLRMVLEEFARLMQGEYKEQSVVSFGELVDRVVSWFTGAAEKEEKARKSVEDCRAHGGSGEKLDRLVGELRKLTEENLDKAKKDLGDGLKKLQLEGKCIEKHDLQMLARGLYVDALVGAVPSTETYSERMREQMVALKMAEVAVTRADARYRESLAQHLAPDGGNGIVGIMPHRERNVLTLTLKFPLGDGKWDFVLDGKNVCAVPPDQLGSHVLNLSLDGDQQALADDALMRRSLALHNRDRGIVVGRM